MLLVNIMNKLLYIILLPITIFGIIIWQLLPLVPEQPTPLHHTDSGFKNSYPGYEEKEFGDFLFWILIDRAINGRTKGPEMGGPFNLPYSNR